MDDHVNTKLCKNIEQLLWVKTETRISEPSVQMLEKEKAKKILTIDPSIGGVNKHRCVVFICFEYQVSMRTFISSPSWLRPWQPSPW